MATTTKKVTKKPPAVVVMSKLASHDDTRDLLVELSAVANRLGTVAMSRSEPKLARLSRIVQALAAAVMLDEDARNLDRPDRWACDYLARRGGLSRETFTAQDDARRIRGALEAKVDAKPKPTREAVAAWLANEIEGALALYAEWLDGNGADHALVHFERMRKALTEKILMMMRFDGERGSDRKGEFRARPFLEKDLELVIGDAFKAGGMRTSLANQLFKSRK